MSNPTSTSNSAETVPGSRQSSPQNEAPPQGEALPQNDWLRDEHWRDWATALPVARLSTLRKDGAPHIVPVVCVLLRNAWWIPVDGKPKRGANLARLNHLKHDSRCCLLFDEYSNDWQALRWLRLDGIAEVVVLTAREADDLTSQLRRKYPQYMVTEPLPPPATAIRFTWNKATRWRASVG